MASFILSDLPQMTRRPPMTQGKKVKLLFGSLSSMSTNNLTSTFLGLQQGLWMQSLTSEGKLVERKLALTFPYTSHCTLCNAQEGSQHFPKPHTLCWIQPTAQELCILLGRVLY